MEAGELLLRARDFYHSPTPFHPQVYGRPLYVDFPEVHVLFFGPTRYTAAYPLGYLPIETDEKGISFHRRVTEVRFMTGDRLCGGSRQRVTIRAVRSASPSVSERIAYVSNR